MCFGVVASVGSSEDEGEGQPVDEPAFLEADRQLVSVLLPLDVVGLLDIVLQRAGVDPPDYKIILCQFKYLIEHGEIGLVLLGEHHSLAERCVGECFGDEVEELALALELALAVVVEMGHVSVGPVDAVHDLALHVLGREEAVLGEEDIVAVHEVVEVVGDDRHSAVVDEDALAVLLERLDPAHIHRVLVVAEVKSAAIGADWRVCGAQFVGSGGAFAGRFVGQRAVHLLMIK